MSIREQIKRHEGRVINKDGRHVVYDDATGKPLGPGDTLIGHPTIGYGRNVQDNGISELVVDLMLDFDVAEVKKRLGATYWWFLDVPLAVQHVLINMAFQLGMAGLSGFEETLAHLESGNYELAADEMLNSLWARQVPSRATELSVMVLNAVDENPCARTEI